ncbi:uncharacterized protein HKW66_Vig0097540 [Vigna angularis]|uniref:AB hydrolase-1 domain-containing protein n=2 Tax=Phaseolus angularis TaxID=3914 RepID=A0A8T0KMS7_PHAAN|nr:uncharacterized protein LOC108331091 [Vigna angularis]KAG2400392.1 uncharacterized protein HKW66_Vig0097540 [Vigna angularis]BAT78035.1 hypothetical protein VIGAN_02066400 [Vigna angularis var. angularis]
MKSPTREGATKFINMPSSFNFACMYNKYIRRCFTGAGLWSQALALDDETTMHFWGPRNKTAQKPSLVLIHGFGPVATWQWRRQVKSLAPHFNLYVPDLVFFGGSTTVSSERSEVFQAKSVGKLLDKLEVETLHVVGTSYGGLVAYNLAKMLGEGRVKKVVIASSGVNMTARSNLEMLRSSKLNNIDDLMFPSSPHHLRQLMSLSIYKPPHVPDFVLSIFIHELYGENKERKLEILKGISVGREETSNVSPLKQKVLIVWGEEDRVFPVRLAHELKQLIGKDVKLELIKEAAHVPQIEKPVQFNRIIINFLRGTH